MSKLAIHGGAKAVAEKYQNSVHPQISEEFYKQIDDANFRSQITAFDAPIITDFQNKAKEYFGLKHILPTNSGTSALFEMFYAVGLKQNDEVIVPVYTFFATATPLFVLGCSPILADCLDNGNIDPQDIRKKITSKTKAIVITHMWGIPCDMDEILEISREFNIPVLEDVSHAHGAMYKGKMTGTFGKCAAWSLGAKKLITGGQGGMLGTNDDEVYQKAILLGHANNKRIKAITLENLLPYSVSGVGLNLRMHPFSAALIIEQLNKYPLQVTERNEVAKYLIEEISAIPGLKIPRIPDDSIPAWYGLPVIYDATLFGGLSREKFVDALIAEGATGYDIPHTTSPLTEYEIFNERGVFFESNKKIKKFYKNKQFQNAEAFHRNIFKLPVWYGKDRIGYAKAHIAALKKVVMHFTEI